MVKIWKSWPALISAILLFLIFCIALVVRVVLPYSHVFTSNGVIFTGNDAYWDMRLVSLFVHDFPHFPTIDPYFMYPGGPLTVVPNFFQWVIGVGAWIVGLGHPSQHLIDVVGAWTPPVMGSLTIIPVYFIAKALWGRHGRWAGLVAATLVTVLPGEFLGRSILGFTEYHIGETLLATTSILFLILAVKSASQRALSFAQLRRPEWDKARRPLLFAILSGLFLGLYIWCWQGALLMVFTIVVYLVIQFIIDHLRGRSTDYLSIVGVAVFLISLIFIPESASAYPYAPSLVIAVLVPAGLGVMSRLMAERRLNRAFYPLAIVVIGLAGLGIFYLIRPSTVDSMLAAFSVFRPTGALLTTVQAQSIFTPLGPGGFLDTPAWLNFYFSLPIAVAALVVVILYSVVKRGNTESCAFTVWTIIMIVATIGQRRFAYYSVVNMALLAGYGSMLVYYLIALVLARTGGDRTASFSTQALDLDGLTVRVSASGAAQAVPTRRVRRRERQEARRREIEQVRLRRQRNGGRVSGRGYLAMGLSAVILFFVLFAQLVAFPDPAHGLTLPPTIATASSTPYAPTSAWVDALTWMKDNTPEPFGSADSFYHFQTPPKGKAYTYPSSVYGVLSWWDYGYWITYIGQRVPNANPGQASTAVTKVADFLTSQNETAANPIAQELDSKYVVIDYQTATSKFYAVATWAGQSSSEYEDVYYVPQQSSSQLSPVQLYYPSYYESMTARLYNFDGKAVTTDNVTVISYQNNVDKASGQSFKEITGAQQFTSYQDAENYISQQKTGNYRIVGIDPMTSPVNLAPLQGYKLIYSSPQTVSLSSGNQTAQVKIFERVQ